ncbi:MAG: acyl carrier protein [Candidatus Lindowbacteria bacterium]|nr:acyl carrier protein [Candidatus Lindowbacteria bacterium]
MNRQAASDQIRTHIRGQALLGRDDVTLDDNTHLTESGILDSFGVVEMIAYVEESFEVEFDPNDLVTENLGSIANIVDFLCKKHALSE